MCHRLARGLLHRPSVDRGVIAAATELFDARHFPGVVALCTDALDAEPESVPCLVLRARARIALRRDLDAQADLRDIIRLDPRCAIAYRLLGVLAARRDENESAAIFFREALRLDPDDVEAGDWLQIALGSLRVAAPGARRPRAAPALADDALTTPRFARGTRPPDPDERPTWPFPQVAARRPAPPPVAAPPRASLPELPGFGDYLVATGILSRDRLRAAIAYQHSMKVALSTAIVALGLASPQRIEWAVVAHQAATGRLL